jgi:hypothetical protein
MNSPKRVEVISSRLTSMASDVRLRMLVANVRTMRPQTTSSIGSRSWLMTLDLMRPPSDRSGLRGDIAVEAEQRVDARLVESGRRPDRPSWADRAAGSRRNRRSLLDQVLNEHVADHAGAERL